ncbi:MAG: hypothetical protein IH991_18160 [Planctomycetes bacterium]|nr:hypothetical protein [Planctomycetota bacterium]
MGVILHIDQSPALAPQGIEDGGLSHVDRARLHVQIRGHHGSKADGSIDLITIVDPNEISRAPLRSRSAAVQLARVVIDGLVGIGDARAGTSRSAPELTRSIKAAWFAKRVSNCCLRGAH